MILTITSCLSRKMRNQSKAHPTGTRNRRGLEKSGSVPIGRTTGRTPIGRDHLAQVLHETGVQMDQLAKVPQETGVQVDPMMHGHQEAGRKIEFDHLHLLGDEADPECNLGQSATTTVALVAPECNLGQSATTTVALVDLGKGNAADE